MELKVYLCGGIAGLTDEEAKGWRDGLKKEMPHITFLDPMDRDYRNVKIDEALAEDIVYEDLDDIKNSDVILVNATKPSWGTAMEICYTYWKEMDKIIVIKVGADEKQISPWLIFHNHFMYDNWHDVITLLNKLYKEKKEV